MDLHAMTDIADAAMTAVVSRWPVDAEPLPERRYISNGLVAWDCESLVVMVESTFGSSGDVAAEQYAQGIGFAMRAMIFGVLLLRCVPDVVDDGDGNVSPPSADAIEASSRIILTDPVAILNCLVDAQLDNALATCSGLAFERWTSQGPEGGLGGGILRARVLLL